MMLGLIEAEPPSTTEHSGLPIDHFFEQKLQKVMASSLVRGNQQLRAYIKKWTDPGKAKRKVYPLKGLPTLRLEAKGLKAWAFRRSVFRYMGHEA